MPMVMPNPNFPDIVFTPYDPLPSFGMKKSATIQPDPLLAPLTNNPSSLVYPSSSPTSTVYVSPDISTSSTASTSSTLLTTTNILIVGGVFIVLIFIMKEN